MQVPVAEYTLDTFLDYLRENHDTVFDEEERKKWLRIYCVLHTLPDWRSVLFARDEVRNLGAVSEIHLTREDDGKSGGEDLYYAVEYRPGLLLFFTSVIQESYEATLGDRIQRKRGVTEATISAALFQRVWQSILENYGGYVYRFTSRRAALDDTPSQVRPSYKRRFSYTGDDATFVVKELQDQYGVTPESMYLRITPSLVIQITRSGFFAAKEILPPALEIFLGVLSTVKDELLETKSKSESLRFETPNILGEASLPRVASITAGQILLQGRPLSADVVREFVSNAEDFSFTDYHMIEGSMAFSSTVVDEVKGSVFDISMTEREITMIPKYNTTFESFIGFLNAVREQLDEQATLSIWGLREG